MKSGSRARSDQGRTQGCGAHHLSALGAGGGAGDVAEYTGSVIRDMAIEAGARSGLVALDAKAFAYLQGRRRSPESEIRRAALAHGRALKTDPDAIYDKVVMIDASGIAPLVTWGTSPDDPVPVTGVVPNPAMILDPAMKASAERSLDYMALIPGTPIQAIPIAHVFIGSCTNGRIEDLRIAAQLVRGHRVAESIKQALVVPGSSAVKRQAEAEGLDAVFLKAGFEWREPGCSMCLAMNPD